MHYKANTPQEYLESLDEDWRKEKLLTVRDMILNYGQELKETIAYKMLAYQREEKSIFHLTAQKNYVSLYVGSIGKVEGSDDLLQGFDTGKGCIRIKKSMNLKQSGLEKFIEKTMAITRSGGDTAC